MAEDLDKPRALLFWVLCPVCMAPLPWDPHHHLLCLAWSSLDGATDRATSPPQLSPQSCRMKPDQPHVLSISSLTLSLTLLGTQVAWALSGPCRNWLPRELVLIGEMDSSWQDECQGDWEEAWLGQGPVLVGGVGGESCLTIPKAPSISESLYWILADVCYHTHLHRQLNEHSEVFSNFSKITQLVTCFILSRHVT